LFSAAAAAWYCVLQLLATEGVKLQGSKTFVFEADQ
jgi:hypothetical protein